MPTLFSRQPVRRPQTPPRCPWCGSALTARSRNPGTYYCHRCLRAFGDAPEVPFDFIFDQWAPELAALQATGDLIAVRLPEGFYGICILAEEDLLTSLRREKRRGAVPIRGGL